MHDEWMDWQLDGCCMDKYGWLHVWFNGWLVNPMVGWLVG